jgi:C-terminal processing protease CtpA/Prc
MNQHKTKWISLTVLACVAAVAEGSAQQRVNKAEEGQARAILQQVEDTILKNYYDPTFHGLDLHARFKEADEQLAMVPNLVAGLGIIASAVESLNDSHTLFIPPMRNVIVYSGWQMEMVGENCFVSAVEPDSDALRLGLRPGDQILRIESYQPTRATLPAIKYRLKVLYPLVEYHLVVASPGQAAREVTTKSRLVTLPQTANSLSGGDGQHQLDRLREGYEHLGKSRTVELNSKLMMWKLPQFNLSPPELEHLVEIARKHEALILDLRDNGGGGDEQMRLLIASVFDHDLTIGEMIERKKNKPLQVTSRKKSAFGGKLFVLVNSASASASEVFARTVQLEKRGVIVGDDTAGFVGRGQVFVLQQGGLSVTLYGVEVTTARLRMSDGSDLEGTGVKPDLKVVPTGSDLAEGNDPVLAAAAHLAGVELSPEQAGKLFPTVWATR